MKLVETDQKSTKEYHEMKPFMEERLEWGGNEKPAMYILWLKEYNEIFTHKMTFWNSPSITRYWN